MTVARSGQIIVWHHLFLAVVAERDGEMWPRVAWVSRAGSLLGVPVEAGGQEWPGFCARFFFHRADDEMAKSGQVVVRARWFSAGVVLAGTRFTTEDTEKHEQARNDMAEVAVFAGKGQSRP